MIERRVAVTGIGLICSLGQTTSEVWDAARNGRTGISRVQALEAFRLRFQNGAEVANFDPLRHFDPRKAEQLDRFTQFGVVAAKQAVADAGVVFSSNLLERTAVATGTSMGGQSSQDAEFVGLYRQNLNRVHPLTIPRTMYNAAASQIAMEIGSTGPAFTFSTACSSSTHAIGHAFWLVRNGISDLAIAGGSEAPFSFGILKAWEAMRVVSPDTCRPFSKDRRGLILGEGAGMLVLEPMESALSRGAKIYAEIVGFGMSSDAHHITQPTVDGPTLAMRSALADAKLAPEQIDYINAHGTGTPANDAVETQAIRRVFGSHADHLAISSSKSMHGHVLGAGGALEAGITAISIGEGIIPPTANFTEPDPACDLDVVPNTPRTARIEAALSNSFAFGGLNAVLAFQSHR